MGVSHWMKCSWCELWYMEGDFQVAFWLAFSPKLATIRWVSPWLSISILHSWLFFIPWTQGWVDALGMLPGFESKSALNTSQWICHLSVCFLMGKERCTYLPGVWEPSALDKYSTATLFNRTGLRVNRRWTRERQIWRSVQCGSLKHFISSVCR